MNTYYELISTLFGFIIDFCYNKSAPQRKGDNAENSFILILCSVSAYASCSCRSLKQNALGTVSEHVRENITVFCTVSRLWKLNWRKWSKFTFLRK